MVKLFNDFTKKKYPQYPKIRYLKLEQIHVDVLGEFSHNLGGQEKDFLKEENNPIYHNTKIWQLQFFQRILYILRHKVIPEDILSFSCIWMYY